MAQRRNGQNVFTPPGHNHEVCKRSLLVAAEKICRARNVRFTPLRRRVLEILGDSHEPLGAYAILSRLVNEGQSGPPTVYRALEFLLEQGLIHRVPSLNAYVGCARPGVPHSGQFFICRSCHVLTELDDRDIEETIRRRAQEVGFEVQSQSIENFGLCLNCQ